MVVMTIRVLGVVLLNKQHMCNTKVMQSACDGYVLHQILMHMCKLERWVCLHLCIYCLALLTVVPSSMGNLLQPSDWCTSPIVSVGLLGDVKQFVGRAASLKSSQSLIASCFWSAEEDGRSAQFPSSYAWVEVCTLSILK